MHVEMRLNEMVTTYTYQKTTSDYTVKATLFEIANGSS